MASISEIDRQSLCIVRGWQCMITWLLLDSLTTTVPIWAALGVFAREQQCHSGGLPADCVDRRMLCCILQVSACVWHRFLSHYRLLTHAWLLREVVVDVLQTRRSYSRVPYVARIVGEPQVQYY